MTKSQIAAALVTGLLQGFAVGVIIGLGVLLWHMADPADPASPAPETPKTHYCNDLLTGLPKACPMQSKNWRG